MGTYGGLWGPMATCWHLWAPMGTYGRLWGPVGTYGGLWGLIGTYGGLWGPIRTYQDLWGPMGTFGDPLAPMGTYGGLWGPMGTCGVGGDQFLHTHFDTPPLVQASDLYSTYHTSCCIHCKNNMPHQTSDIKLYTQSCHGPVGTLFLGLILCLVPMTPCETMLYWPSPN